MPGCEPHSMSVDQRHREVAAILARGLLRLRRKNRSMDALHAPKPQDSPKNGLELPGETRLNVPHGTRGLRLRGDGDEAWA